MAKRKKVKTLVAQMTKNEVGFGSDKCISFVLKDKKIFGYKDSRIKSTIFKF